MDRELFKFFEINKHSKSAQTGAEYDLLAAGEHHGNGSPIYQFCCDYLNILQQQHNDPRTHLYYAPQTAQPI